MKLRNDVFIYKNRYLKNIGFPLGGIGCGSISLNGDGCLVEWQIFNRVNKRALIPNTYFYIWIEKSSGEKFYRVLKKGFLDFPTYLPGVEDVEIIGEYPIIYVKYMDKGMPIDIFLEAFSPFIPLNVRDSAIPCIFFIFHIYNKSNEDIDVSIAFSLENTVGYDGFSPIYNIHCKCFNKNYNRLVKEEKFTEIYMSADIDENNINYGSMAIALYGDEASYISQTNNLRYFWNDFSKDGILNNIDDSTPSDEGSTWIGILASKKKIRPGEWGEIAYLLAWHFPNRVVDWGKYKGYRVGNMYNNWFKNADTVIRYAVENFDRLVYYTRLFRETFFSTTLPYYVLNRISSQISTIRCPTCMWFEDGTFAGFEGCALNVGCCPMNCTHVWNYEQTMAFLFPSLEKDMRMKDLSVQLMDNGLIHHRLVIPLNMPRASGLAIDGQLGTILKTYREFLITGDIKFIEKYWDNIRKALNYVIENFDPMMKGVISGKQPNTYDCSLYGYNSFVSSLYLAVIKAMEKMASYVNDKEYAEKCREIYRNGFKELDNLLWNGEYYIQIYDEKSIDRHQYGKGCLSDQLLGQWWAHILGLGYILPQKHVERAVKSIYQYNWREDLSNHMHSQRAYAISGEAGLLNCSWPHGGRPENPILYCDEVWTGIEYEIASLLIYEGYVNEGLNIVRGVFNRYDGRVRNPWNEIECGDHYTRGMSSWSLLLALEGYSYNGYKGEINFNPKINYDDFRGFFSTGSGWGLFTQKRTENEQVNKLILKYGNLSLNQVGLKIPLGRNIKSIEAYLNRNRIDISWKNIDGKVLIKSVEKINMVHGEELEIDIKY